MIRRFNLDEEEQIAGIRRYWDARAERTEAAEFAQELGSELQSTIERVHALDDAPPASGAFRAALLRQLMDAPAQETQSLAATGNSSRDWEGVPEIPAIPENKWRRGGPMIPRWLAALSVGVAVVVLLTALAGTRLWGNEDRSEHSVVPLRTTTTEDEVVIRTLVEEHVPPGVLDTNPTQWIASFKFSLEPGEAWRDRPSPCELSRQYVVGLVESGTLSMITTGPFEIRRSDGNREQIPAGQRADVRAGDSWIYFADRSETNVQKWNAGNTAMVAYQTDWALDESCESAPVNPEWHWSDSTVGVEIDPSLPLVASIEQVFVGPGAPLSWDDAVRIGLLEGDSGLFSVVGIESGVLEFATVPVDLTSNLPGSFEAYETFALTPGESWSPQVRPGPLDDHEWQFRNGSEEMLVMTSISWVHDTDATSARNGKETGEALDSILARHLQLS